MTETAMNPRHRARHGRKEADVFMEKLFFMVLKSWRADLRSCMKQRYAA
jgi:hypothetical protein